MILNKLIVHELQKEYGSTKVQTFASDKLIPIDSDSQGLIEALLSSYQGDKILYAEFNQASGNYFPSRIDQYRQTKRTEQDFINFTRDSLLNLVNFIKTKTLAKGGYLVFAEYENNGISFIAIFLIRDTEGKLLRKTKSSFEVKTIEYLDTNHLAMACRINENKINENESNYLSFTRLRQKDVSDYFTDWISIKQLESNTEFTNALYQIINGITTPIDPETNERYSIDEIRNKVYENAKNNAQRNINIHALSEQIYGDPNVIAEYAEQHDISIDTEFRYDKRALKRFIQLNVNKDGINLRFSRGDVGTKVRPSDENQNMVLIESEKFANALRTELEQDE